LLALVNYYEAIRTIRTRIENGAREY